MSAERKAEIHDELAALARLALNGDGAAHQVHNVLGDGHAEAGALNAADGGVFLTGELLKDVLLELLAHADAVVLDAELIAGPARRRTVFLGNTDADHAACGGKLDGIGQNVQQDLVQPQRVGDDILVLHIHGINEKRQPLCRNIGLDDGAHIVDEVRQMHRFFLDLYLSALDAAHIQHIIDEGKQMLAGGRDLFQVVQHLFLIINMGRSQRGEADDGVHGGADIVAHIEQELPLGAVCRPLVLKRDLQLAVLLFQLGLILPLLLFFLLFHLLHGAAAQQLKDHYKQDVSDQRRQDQRKRLTEDHFFIRVRIEIEGSAMAEHPEIAAGAVPVPGMGQLLCGTGFADPLHQRAVRSILPDQLRAVCGNDLIVLHDEQRAAGFCRVAIQYALDGQRRFLHKFRRGIPVGKQEQLCAFCPVCRNIHSRAIFQQDALHISLSRVR